LKKIQTADGKKGIHANHKFVRELTVKRKKIPRPSQSDPRKGGKAKGGNRKEAFKKLGTTGGIIGMSSPRRRN